MGMIGFDGEGWSWIADRGAWTSQKLGKPLNAKRNNLAALPMAA